MREIDCILIHASDSDIEAHDNIETIRKWHVEERGFSDVGYHAFINKKGELFQGRPDSQVGAHCSGHNKTSLGVCLSGKDPKKFTPEQFKTLEIYLIEKCSEYGLEKTDIYGHKHFDKHGKTCPNFDVEKWLSGLEWR